MFSLRCLNLLMSSWPLTTLVARLLWLRALCAVAEGAAVAAEADCVVTAAAARMAAFHGRDAQPRSLASVYGCFVTLFLGGGVRGVVSRVISAKMAGFRPFAFSDGGSLLLAIARCRLLVCDARTHDGALLRKIGRFGKGRRQFNWPRDICVPPDGFVFIADTGNCRVQVLTPTLEFHSFISTLDRCPFCVCANATVVCTIAGNEGVDVFSRVHGTFLRRLPNAGFRYVDAGFVYVGGMCLAPCNNYVAVSVERRIVVAALDGTSVFSIVHPLVVNPCDIAWSAHNEIFAAHSLRNAGFSAFSPDGTLLARFGSFTSHGISLHRNTLAVERDDGIVVYC